MDGPVSDATRSADPFGSLTVELSSTVDRVVEELRRAVFEGDLESGTPLREVALAESLGGIESLIEHPARMTHASVTGTALQVPADLIRLSVGLEDVDDLIRDLGEALAIHA